jgi:hypothetical protein
MMLVWDYRGIDSYERIWRKNHGISEGQPSTLFKATKEPEAGDVAPPKIKITKPKPQRRLPTVTN